MDSFELPQLLHGSPLEEITAALVCTIVLDKDDKPAGVDGTIRVFVEPSG